MNATDNHSRTALHWAAAVNNWRAAEILLKCGANRDVQDDKEETPLFLAAKECSYETARLLIENYANKDIPDYLDKLPLDIAVERQHHKIVNLLREHKVRPPPSLLMFRLQLPAKYRLCILTLTLFVIGWLLLFAVV